MPPPPAHKPPAPPAKATTAATVSPGMPAASPAKPPFSARPAAASRPAKTFSIGTHGTTGDGAKIILYGKTGNGKTTLASLRENIVFLSMTDGQQRVVNPITGKECQVVQGIRDFYDVRDALHQKGLFPDKCSICVDTVTKLEAVTEQYIYDNYPAPGKSGGRATHMRGYGWDAGAHRLDAIRLLITDFDPHVAVGRDVILLAQQSQVKISTSAGLDYYEDGPKLDHNNQQSSRMEICEWADHVLRIGYLGFDVTTNDDKARVGKVVAGDLERAVFAGGQAHFLAKTRLINGKRLPPVVSFANERDDSLWQMIFNGAIPDT